MSVVTVITAFPVPEYRAGVIWPSRPRSPGFTTNPAWSSRTARGDDQLVMIENTSRIRREWSTSRAWPSRPAYTGTAGRIGRNVAREAAS
jgi:hypothetical protein